MEEVGKTLQKEGGETGKGWRRRKLGGDDLEVNTVSTKESREIPRKWVEVSVEEEEGGGGEDEEEVRGGGSAMVKL